MNRAANLFPILIVFVLPASLLLPGCAEKKTQLEQIREQGEVRVIIKPGPTTYERNDREEERGLEYELVRLFAAWLGVDFKLILAEGR